MKFLALYMATQEAIDRWSKSSTKEEQEKGMVDWQKWFDAHKTDFIDLGAMAGKNKRIDSSGVKDERNGVCGYSIVQANSHEEAMEIFKDNPQAKEPDTWVDVLPCLEMK